MRFRHLLLAPALVLAACTADTATSTSSDITSIVPEYVNSSASATDPAGVGGIRFPDSLGLTTEQKAAIEGLHAAFQAATATDVEALRAIETQARDAKRSGKSESDIHAILAQAAPILTRMNNAFAAFQTAIMQVYTPAQHAWIASHQPRPCGPDGPPRLTDAQMQQIHALQEAFMNAVRNDVAMIRQIADSAHAAANAGASHDAINQILH